MSLYMLSSSSSFSSSSCSEFSPDDHTIKRIIQLTQKLVQIPSQGGIDDPQSICQALVQPMKDANLVPQLLYYNDDDDDDDDDDNTEMTIQNKKKEQQMQQPKLSNVVGVIAEIKGSQPGPMIVLDAVIDTAPVGDVQLWSRSPFSGDIVKCSDKQSSSSSSTLLYGRGSADSKVAAAMFVEIGRQLMKQQQQQQQNDSNNMKGTLILFFDAAEHTGKFQGIKALLQKYPKLRQNKNGELKESTSTTSTASDDGSCGVIIGYPGNDALNIGSRGFERSVVTIELPNCETGNEHLTFVGKAILDFQQTQLPDPTGTQQTDHNDEFPLSPKRTITALQSQSKQTCTSSDTEGLLYHIHIGGTSYHSGSSKNLGINAAIKMSRVLVDIGSSMKTCNIKILQLASSQGFSIIPDVADVHIAIMKNQHTSNKESLLHKVDIQRKLEMIVANIHTEYPSKGDCFVNFKGKVAPNTLLEIMSSFSINIDTRTTPTFGTEESCTHLQAIGSDIMKTITSSSTDCGAIVRICNLDSWPAFLLPPHHALRQAMESSIIAEYKGKIIPSKVSGPSNVGNLLAQYNIPATTGYGVDFGGMHATDEYIDLDTIPTAFAVHLSAIHELFGMKMNSTQ